MFRKAVMALGCMLVATALVLTGTTSFAAGKVLTVKQDGTGDFTKIQQAVNVAQPGDVVVVYPGRYNTPDASWRGRHNRRDWNSVFATVREGRPDAPITIKARYPARQPLNGAEWAEGDAAKQTILDGEIKPGENLPVCGLLLHSYVTLDGFVVKNGDRYGVFGSPRKAQGPSARRLWVKNCRFLTNSVAYADRRQSENHASLSLSGWGVPDCLVQNNFFDTEYCCAVDLAGARNGVVEYNEFANWAVYAIYAHGGSFANDDLVVRYNYFHPRRPHTLMRLRDSLRYLVHNNVIIGPSAGIFMDDHTAEHPDRPDDRYAAHHNTIVNVMTYAIGYQTATHPAGQERPTAYNIITGKTRMALNLSPWGAPSKNVHIVNNIVAPGIPIIGGNKKGLVISTWVEKDNIVADPKLDEHYRSTVFDNKVYGANLDVREIPYRGFDGKPYPVHTPYPILVPKKEASKIDEQVMQE